MAPKEALAPRTVSRETAIRQSARAMQVRGMFDVPDRDTEAFEVTIPEAVKDLERKDWNVGLIVGPSGSGKSTVARELWPDEYDRRPEWDLQKPIVDAFPRELPVREAVGFLTSVGLGAPPSWLRPYHTLSTGEQFRALVARQIAENELSVIDEFTSTVDRQVAQVASHATQKAVRRAGRKLVAVTCHFDLIDWLQPDWVWRPDTVDFEWRRLQRRPPLDVTITTLPHSAWGPFSRHHYLSHVLHGAAKCFGMWLGDECIAFNSYIPFPHPIVKNIRMGHRLVVLPDYQGLGLGLVFDNWLGERLHAAGYRYHKTISHPALIHAFARSPRWTMMKGSNKPTRGGAKRLRKTMQSTRKLATRGFRYVPEQA